MSLGPAGGSLLTRRRLSPRATPRTRSLHSLRNLPTRGAAGLAAVVLAGVGMLALQYSRKGPADDESAARMKEGDLKARFEDWAKKYNRTYRDEEEKAMRFQVFKDTIEWIESRPPSHRDMLRPLNCFADLKREEIHPRSCVIEIDDPETREYNKKLNEWLARKDKGERFIWPPVEQGDKQATQLNSRILSGVTDIEARLEADNSSLPRTVFG